MSRSSVKSDPVDSCHVEPGIDLAKLCFTFLVRLGSVVMQFQEGDDLITGSISTMQHVLNRIQ